MVRCVLTIKSKKGKDPFNKSKIPARHCARSCLAWQVGRPPEADSGEAGGRYPKSLAQTVCA